jgi:hypothetical protein
MAGVAALGLAASSASAQVVLTIPDECKPEGIANTVMGVVGPFIPTIVTVASTMLVGVVLYRVIVRKVAAFGSQA